MKYKIAVILGVMIVVFSMYIDANIKHNSLNPVGTNLTAAGIAIGAIITFTAGFLNWRHNRNRRHSS